jgi:hypothetical protein
MPEPRATLNFSGRRIPRTALAPLTTHLIGIAAREDNAAIETARDVRRCSSRLHWHLDQRPYRATEIDVMIGVALRARKSVRCATPSRLP